MTTAKKPVSAADGGSSGCPVMKAEDVKILAQALTVAAAALRDVERLMVLVAPKNALKAEKLAEEYETAAKVLVEEKLNTVIR